jgi:hypothetical protein
MKNHFFKFKYCIFKIMINETLFIQKNIIKNSIRKTPLFFIFFLCFLKIFSCDCPKLQKLNMEYCSHYSLIFKGTVRKVSTCNEINHALINIQELFKGEATKNIELYFDCSSDCKMNLMVGETWIIYANFIQLNKPKVEFCSRSRKLIDNEIKVASNFIASDLGFNEEVDWLKENLGIKKIITEDRIKTFDTHRNQLPEKKTSLLLILFSLLFFLILIFIIKKYFK